MEWYFALLRWLHILAGVAWVGGGLLMALAISPVLLRTEVQSAARFFRALSLHRTFNLLFPVTALLTTIPGLIVFYESSGGFDADWMGTTPGIVLSMGVLFGVLGFLHGGGSVGRKTGEIATLLQGAGDPLSGEEQASFRRAVAGLQRSSTVSMGLLLVAVVCMAGWRYL